MADVFENLAEKLKRLPEELDKAYREVTQKEIKEAGDTMRDFFNANSGSASLNAQMTTEFVISGDYYAYNITWDDEIIVNVDKGNRYGRDRDKPRLRGKRNYSIRPATYHDLAYIINQGHGGVMGNRFIERGRNRVKKWKFKRDNAFKVKEAVIAKEFE